MKGRKKNEKAHEYVDRLLRHDTGTGHTVTMCLWVCLGTGRGCEMPYPGNTVPFPWFYGYHGTGHLVR